MTLVVPQGELLLERHPTRSVPGLQAWDAADEYLLRAVADPARSPRPASTVVIVNDGFGALATALAGLRPSAVSDSYVSQLATRHNLSANGIDAGQVDLLASFDPMPDRIDLLVVKVPRNLALLDDQLRRLRPSLHPDSVVVGAAMVKHLHSSTLERFEQRIGPTTTSRAERRARLVFATVERSLPLDEPDPWPTSYEVEPGGVVAISHAGVFSADHLDIGTRFLLEHLPGGAGGGTVVDLGCGNGVVGTMVAVADPGAEIVFVDESYRAVASAETTFRANLGPARPARFVIGDGLTGFDDGSVDRVIVNPPFHVDRAMGDAVAWQMLLGARRVLRRGGELVAVGNRHLGYHAKLSRLFGASEVVASNPKFVVLRAVRR
jgi:23S rRNA (guanine1835-N2)-methyltransferase